MDLKSFFDNMLLAAEQVAILYVIVAIGVLGDKTGLFTEKTARLCTNLLFFIITPAVIVRSFLAIEYEPRKAGGLFIAIGCGLLMHTIAALMNMPLFRKGDKSKNAVYKFACVYGNCGYMALPLADAILGPEGVFYCSAVIMSFQMFVFTHGIYIMSEADENGKRTFRFSKLIVNPGSLSVLVGLPLFLLDLGDSIPAIFIRPVQYIASMNTPLAMLIFGTYLANVRVKKVFADKRVFGVALMKLLVLPVVMLCLYKLFGISGVLLSSLAISASAPPANNTVIFAAKYDKDTVLASQTVAVVSFISIATMPFMIALTKVIG